MASFDTVSEIDLQELDNAINNVKKELNTRFDFKGSNTSVELNKKDKVIKILTTDEMKMNIMREMIISSATKRSVDSRFLEFCNIEKAGGSMLSRDVKVKEGIDKEVGKKITATIKTSGLKVSSSIMDNKVRVEGKKIDDLQAVITLLKKLEIEVPLQFINMRS